MNGFDKDVLMHEEQRAQRDHNLRMWTRFIIGAVLITALVASCSVAQTALTSCALKPFVGLVCAP